jgi:diaminopimelate decarboxylase
LSGVTAANLTRYDGPLRVAVVGAGPKGLFALERLLDHAHRAGAQAVLDVDVFEPHGCPGAGPVYDPAQPEYLRMNLAADRLSMWWPASRAVPADAQLSFNDWVAARDAASERYPPRALVGRYLADGLALIRHHARGAVRLTLRRQAVRCVRRRDDRWHVEATDGSTRRYDEVLVSVGHEAVDERRAVGTWMHAAPLLPAVFPVTRWLAPEHVAPGAVVATRGFALTFIDAAIALTEGRGGSFESDDHPYRLRYVPSPEDVATILPFSRTGRPMLAKPGPQLQAVIPELAVIAEGGRAQILALSHASDPMPELMMILATATSASLQAATARGSAAERSRQPSDAARRWLASACDGAPTRVTGDPVLAIERSLAIGAGLQPPDLSWALGQTWRTLYPALVARFSHAGLPAAAWPAFRRLASELERLAFGPPAINAAKLLALVAAGRVDLTHVAAGRLVTSDAGTTLRSSHGQRAVDVVVDAVLTEPGVPRSRTGLLRRLVTDGHARTLTGMRGVDVAADATCIGAGGTRSAGLAVIGRASEDAVIGNDTLDRTLHAHADRWAQRVVRRSTREREPACSPTTP